jgi:hypothetical protein
MQVENEARRKEMKTVDEAISVIKELPTADLATLGRVIAQHIQNQEVTELSVQQYGDLHNELGKAQDALTKALKIVPTASWLDRMRARIAEERKAMRETWEGGR